MSFTREIKEDSAISLAETPDQLSAIHHPDCAAAIWCRHPLQSFQLWLDSLDPEQLPKARLILRPEAVRDAVSRICETYGTPDSAERNRLVDDIAALSDIFADLMRTKWLRLRLDVIKTNACRRFHIDAVTARLVCTYRGTGTQYGISINEAEPDQVVTVPTGAPILLRGTLWPEDPKSGLLHRSPPIEGSGETRLVLVLDPVADPENEFDQIWDH